MPDESHQIIPSGVVDAYDDACPNGQASDFFRSFLMMEMDLGRR